MIYLPSDIIVHYMYFKLYRKYEIIFYFLTNGKYSTEIKRRKRK